MFLLRPLALWRKSDSLQVRACKSCWFLRPFHTAANDTPYHIHCELRQAMRWKPCLKWRAVRMPPGARAAAPPGLMPPSQERPGPGAYEFRTSLGQGRAFTAGRPSRSRALDPPHSDVAAFLEGSFTKCSFMLPSSSSFLGMRRVTRYRRRSPQACPPAFSLASTSRVRSFHLFGGCRCAASSCAASSRIAHRIASHHLLHCAPSSLIT